MSSADDSDMALTPKQRYDRAAAARMREIDARRQVAETYMLRMRNIGFDVTTAHVMSNFTWYQAWANRFISTGQLIKRLALRRMSRSDYMEWSKRMLLPKAVMLDTVRTTAHHIPVDTPYVGGYITGSGVVPWTQAEWEGFPHSHLVYINQDPGAHPDPRSWSVLDMETGAHTPASVAAEHKLHIDAGVQWTCVYGGRANLALATAAIKALDGEYWNGHVCYWLADWDLNEEQASALIGTYIEGASCVGVQWASPKSNPNTIVPGGSLTLGQANIDISVCDGTWIPNVSFGGVPVAPPTPVVEHGEIVTQDSHGNYVGHDVSSTDGTRWQ